MFSKKRIFGLFIAFLLICNTGFAQDLEQSPVKISQEERTRLQAILDAPIDKDALNLNKIAQYRQKDWAAFKL